MLSAALCLIVLLLSAAEAWADTAQQAAVLATEGADVVAEPTPAVAHPISKQPHKRSSAAPILQVLLALGFVVVLIFGLAWLVRRSPWHVPGVDQPLQVLTSVSLGPRERAVLLQVGERQLLLGVAPGRVSLLEAYEQPLLGSKNTMQSGFVDVLQNVLQGKRGSSVVEPPAPTASNGQGVRR